MTPVGNVSPRRFAWAWSLGLLLGAPGCTICPDPFDYSGPVPNGSAPQNDFRARSNGIAPTGGVPRPWPPVVQAVPDRADEPARPDVVATVLGDEAAESPRDSAVVIQATVAEDAAASDAGDAGDAVEAPAVVAPAAADILPPAQPMQPDSGLPQGETPGWRRRD